MLAEVNPVSRRALLRSAELDIEGTGLDLLGLATRGELGLDDFGDVNRPLRPDIIFDSGLVTGLDLDTATDGLTGLVTAVSDDLELVEVDVGDLTLVVDGHTGDIGGLVTDLGLVETDLVALDGVVDGITIGADGTMSGGRGSVTILGLGFTGDLDANRITNTNELTDGANLGGTAAWTGTSGRPENLVALVGTEPILNADISIGSDGGLIGAGGGAVTLTGLGAGDLAVLDAVNLDDDVIEGTVNRFFTATEEGRLAGIEDGATAGADFGVNVSGVPVNLLALVGTEVLDNSEITLDADGSLLGAGGGAVTLSGLGFVGDLDATNDATVDGLITGLTAGSFVPLEAGAVTGQGDLALLDAVDLDTQVTEGTLYRLFTADEQAKLLGIDPGAQVNPLTLFELDPTASAKLDGLPEGSELGALAVKDTIDTGDVVSNSIISVEAFTFGYTVTTENAVSPELSVLVMGFEITTAGEPLLIDVQMMAKFWHPAGGDFSFTLRFLEEGVGTVRDDITINGINGDQYHGYLPVRFTATPGTGTHTYQVRAWASTNTGFTTRQFSDLTAIVTHLKATTI